MKRFRFLHDYAEYKKNDVIDYDKSTYHKVVCPLIVRGIVKVIYPKNKSVEPSMDDADDEHEEEMIEDAIIEEHDDDDREIEETLNKFKMDELRTLGEPYGARDTKKSELVTEIMQKVSKDEILKFIQGD